MIRHTAYKKEQILKEVEETGSVALVAKKHGVPTTTIHTWKKSLKNKDLYIRNKEERKLEKQLADLELENQILKELLKKTHQVWLKS
jgi:transposase-like protein